MMELTFLGTGTSCGVPTIGCECEVCRSSDPKDKRLRCSLLVETESTRVLVDCGPDFRQQIMAKPFRKIDAVLLTHAHYDHVGGIDDLRPFAKFGDVDIYADAKTGEGVRQMLPYCFAKSRYPNIPEILLHEFRHHELLSIGDVNVMPIRVMHGKMPISGFRFDRFAYITDMKKIDEDEMQYLQNLDLLIVNALRFEVAHHSHQLVSDALAFSEKLAPRRTLLVHSSHHIGCHEKVCKMLPDGVDLAYDGQRIVL